MAKRSIIRNKIEYYNTAKAAKTLKKSAGTIATWIREGRIPNDVFRKEGGSYFIQATFIKAVKANGPIPPTKLVVMTEEIKVTPTVEIQPWDGGVLASDNAGQAKLYFTHIRDLRSQSGENDFVVDFDVVWPVAFTRKDNAKRELKKLFMEGTDYQVSLQNEENSNGGRPAEIIMLSIPAVEHFVARKVASIFEVYRQVFHKTADDMESGNLLTVDMVNDMIALAVNESEDRVNLKIKQLEAHLTNGQIVMDKKLDEILGYMKTTSVDSNSKQIKIANQEQLEAAEKLPDADDFEADWTNHEKVKGGNTTVATNLTDREATAEAHTFIAAKKNSGANHNMFMKKFYSLLKEAGSDGHFNRAPGQYFVDVARKGYMDAAYAALKHTVDNMKHG